MIDQKYLELIQAEIDGELAERDRAELARFLLANPEARAVRDDLKRLCETLARVEPVEPPPALRASIRDAVRRAEGKAPVATRRGGWGSPRTLRFAAALAGGLLVSVLAFEIGLDRSSNQDVSQVVGTMASHDSSPGSEPVDTVELALAQVSGSARLFRSHGMRVVEFDLQARQPIEVVVVHDGQESRLSGIGQSGAGEPGHYALALDGPGQDGSAISLKFFASGELIHEDVLQATTPK
jgi:hypothetical protein